MQLSEKWRKTLTETLRRLQKTHKLRAYNPKQILEQLRLIANDDTTSSRNLSLHLRAALRRAVGEGLLKLRGGRYTLAITKKRKVNDNKKTIQEVPVRQVVNDAITTKTSTKKKYSNNRKKKSRGKIKKTKTKEKS